MYFKFYKCFYLVLTKYRYRYSVMFSKLTIQCIARNGMHCRAHTINDISNQYSTHTNHTITESISQYARMQ
jgi:hypothetical protein